MCSFVALCLTCFNPFSSSLWASSVYIKIFFMTLFDGTQLDILLWSFQKHVTYLWSRVLSEKLTCSQLVKKPPHFMEPTCSLPHSQEPITCPYHMSYQSISPGPKLSVRTFHNKIRFYCEELLVPRPNPKLEDHPLEAMCDCLFSIFAATLHIGGCSSIHNLRRHRAVVTGTHYHRCKSIYHIKPHLRPN